jgi:poly(3-hydroxybutyrate) depolymerase
VPDIPSTLAGDGGEPIDDIAASAASGALPLAAADAGLTIATPNVAPSATRPAENDIDAGGIHTVARPSSGCGNAPAMVDVAVNGTLARFLLDFPTGYNERRAYPLVLAFRHTTETAEEFRSRLNLAAIADALIVYANPIEPNSDWQYQTDMPQVDELMKQLGAAYCLDMDRVFVIGDGAGALFANLVGCVRGDSVRAFATLSSAPPSLGPCFGNPAVWLLQRTDTDYTTAGAGLGNRDYWTSRNGCNVFMSEPVEPAPCVEYAGCMKGVPVHFCEYRGAQWPSFAVSGAWRFFESL